MKKVPLGVLKWYPSSEGYSISDQCHDFDQHWSAFDIDRGSLVYFRVESSMLYNEQDFCSPVTLQQPFN